MGDKIVKSKNLCCQPVVFPSLSLLKEQPLVEKSYNIGSNCQEMIYTVTQLKVPTHLTQIYAIESIDPIM